MVRAFLFAALCAASVLNLAADRAAVLAGPVNYPIVYVRAPRYGDGTNTRWPEVKFPYDCEPGTDLVVLAPDGSESVLVAGGNGAAIDPMPSLDGQWVYYAQIPDCGSTALNAQRDFAPRGGADIFKIHVATRRIVRLTRQEWTKNSAIKNVDQGHGVFNLGPCPVPGGRIVFVSSRNGYLPAKDFTYPCLQLFAMDDSDAGPGENVEEIGFLNLGSALHPQVLRDGRILWSSYECQGWRDRRLWGLWASLPDGRYWEPMLSALSREWAFHFHGDLSDGSIVATEYYNQNNNGLGKLLKFPPHPPQNVPAFGSPDEKQNPRLGEVGTGYPFLRYGTTSLIGGLSREDRASGAGKVTHPSGAPGGDCLLVWSQGPANDNAGAPRYDGGIYLLRAGQPIASTAQLTLVKNSPNYNEQQPRALVPYAAIYGASEPAAHAWLPNDGTLHAALPAGTPFGLVGTSSFYRRESKGVNFELYDSNWRHQGSDAGPYEDAEIWGVRLVAQDPTTHTSPPGQRFTRDFLGGAAGASSGENVGNERLRILAEIPLRKFDPQGKPVLDAAGDPDTSFLARIPADTSFTLQMIDRHGRNLAMAQTWHQLRPGEVRTDCRGCHAHSRPGIGFAGTAASLPGYAIADATQSITVDFHRDVLPIFTARCGKCHGSSSPQRGLNLLATGWMQVKESPIARAYRSREGTLAQRVLPGATGHMPPLSEPQPTEAELRTVFRWIDTGMNVTTNETGAGNGVLTDDKRPTLSIQSPARDHLAPLAALRFGAADHYTGLDRASLSVRASLAIHGRAAGAELADLFGERDGVWTLPLDRPVASLAAGTLSVSIRDRAGNESRQVRTFRVAGTLPPAPPPPVPPPDPPPPSPPPEPPPPAPEPDDGAMVRRALELLDRADALARKRFLSRDQQQQLRQILAELRQMARGTWEAPQ